jgi:4-amino-4-deoxy-L-arabinose transferase-like glycosyltransferase
MRWLGTPPPKHRVYPWLAALAGAILVGRLAVTVGDFSPTTDEPCHIGAAVSMVEAHKLIALVSHPPLARWVAVIPLWMDGARLPQCRGVTTVGKEDLGYALGTQVLYNSKASFKVLLDHARLAMLIFPVLALLFVYLLGKMLVNQWTGFIAAAFFSVDPTLLGHGFWICTDAAACAGYLAALYFGLRWLKRPAMGSAAGAGLATGLAISAKFSCVIIIAAMALVAWASRRDVQAGRRRDLFGQLATMAVVGFLAVWATYQFDISPLGDQDVMGHPPQWEHLPAFVRETPVPMPSFFLGLARLAAHDHFGHAAYLNGQVRSSGWWYYFPEILAVKSPVCFLAAIFAAICLCVFTGQWRLWAARAIGIPAGVFLAVAMAGRIDIGIRHILPAIGLLYLLAAWQLSRPGWVWLLMGLVIGSAIETAAVHPDYLSYFNFAAGGPADGDRYAVDSNLDWNQDVYRMADWIKAHDEGRPYAIRLSSQRMKPLLRAMGLDPGALDASPHGRLLFISKNVRLLDGRLPWLARYHAIAHIGYSIDVYDLTGPAGPDEPDDSHGANE